MQPANCDILVGMQYGSEAKGLVAQTIADRYNLAVRIGGANAGHTVRWKDKNGQQEFKARHIPATVLNPDCHLALAAGALVTLDVLDEEIAHLKKLGIEVEHRLHIDSQATIVQHRHVASEHEKKEGSDMFDLIGSTREGVGPALAERVLRRGGVKLAASEPYLYRYLSPTPIAEMIRSNSKVLLEGAQGSLLSNLHGYYPYCTSRETNASGIAAEAGAPPHAIRHVIGVARTYPIRVAGRSGPTGGKETSWEALSAKLGTRVSEQTTVTKRIRRVFEFSTEDFKRACILNKPSILALTFLNYLNKDDFGKTKFEDLSKESRSFIADMESVAQCQVLIMSTSADTVIVRKELDSLL